MTVNLQKH